ncbi:MAG: peptide chain release factor 1 [Micavibrio aeruginosavorus]|uniref:Peptide chain release factor 1 n=1 Tax=Micavibrio aeruginosavorus TaxID=349221 RepID=A0A2W5MY50_9BACT|nr:MAG: peptide chain release factor 1 [Micavibrio aeruginosavorus]
MDYLEKLAPIAARHHEIGEQMSAGGLSGEAFVKLSKEYAELQPVVNLYNEYKKAVQGMADAKEMLSDPDMAEMAQMELDELKDKIPVLEDQIKIALLPKDSADVKNAVMEIRAGTGGDEAALFAADLFTMYKNYAQLQGWRVEVMEMSESDLGGYKEIILSVTGTNVFAKLKYESGGHRVQRVPKTETQGRIHTSAATVAVLPEAEDVDIQLDEKDLRFDVYRSQGSGGQSVNTTDSAVRVTHIPTGVAVAMQEEKSQHKNKAKALKLLKTKLYDLERQKLDSARAADRKGQIGSGDRSERIRTYNFPQSRLTDHRVNLTLYNLDEILAGEGLEEVINTLITEVQAEQLANLEV